MQYFSIYLGTVVSALILSDIFFKHFFGIEKNTISYFWLIFIMGLLGPLSVVTMVALTATWKGRNYLKKRKQQKEKEAKLQEKLRVHTPSIVSRMKYERGPSLSEQLEELKVSTTNTPGCSCNIEDKGIFPFSHYV